MRESVAHYPRDNPLVDPVMILHCMHTMKLIYQRTVGLFKQAWLLPQSIADAVKQRQQKFALNLLEAERLDRIRNPSKYRGK